MVSEDSSNNNNNNNILREFVGSNSFNDDQFAGHHNFDAYQSSMPLGIHSLSERMSRSIDIVRASNQDPHLIDLLGKPSGPAQLSQKLSLSLGGSSVPCSGQRAALLDHGYVINQSLEYNTWPNQSFVASIGNSKYLQPAQSLLLEMLSVDRGNNQCMETRLSRIRGPFRLSFKLKADLSSIESICEKHGDCVSLLKLIALLEEVERRYEEYSHHMEDLVHSFEAIAGSGAGKSYTALAILAMSKHFCRLRNAIVAQVHVTKQKIAKDMPKISSTLSQLCLFDHEARQNRAILHSSVQAWRPLRGLPETSVTILRAWLFEHFLHPYPNDSEKLMLASQTGLSKNQVSNWFINARVRLWKPMIEEMYKEEVEESSTESDQFLANTSTDLGD